MAGAPVVAEAGRHSMWLSGPLGVIHLALQRTATPWMRCPKLGIPSIPLTHAQDVMIYIEAILGRRVEFRQVDR